MRSVGKIVRARREMLGLSQQDAAWLAGVAKSTLRNIEGDRVDEARTWGRIERIYGWAPGSLELMRAGSDPQSVLPEETLKILVRAIIRRISLERENSEECGRVRGEIEYCLKRLTWIRENGKDELEDTRRIAKLKKEIAILGERLSVAERRIPEFKEDTLRLKKSYTQTLGDLLKKDDVPGNVKNAWLRKIVSDIYGIVSPVEAELAAVGLGGALGVDDPKKVLASVYRQEGARSEQEKQEEQLAEQKYEGNRKYPDAEPGGAESMALQGGPGKILVRVSQGLLRVGRVGFVEESDVIQEGPPTSISSAGNTDIMMVMIPLPMDISPELNDADVKWLTESLQRQGIDMARGIVETKRRGRAEQFYEIQDELPHLDMGETKKG